MPVPQDLINVARAELGNDGKKYWEWYFGSGWPYVDGDQTPYCAVWASWCAAMTPVTVPGFPRAVAIDRRDDLGGRMIEPEDLLMGDFLGMDWNGDRKGDHIGLVEARSGNELSIITLEGNTSGGIVARKTRYLSQVTCGVRPRFDGAVIGGGKLDVDGWGGTKTIRKWQEQLGFDPDGVLSDQLYSHDKYRRNILAIDHYYLDYMDDDYMGSSLVRKVQSILKSKGLYFSPIDGDWGPGTTDGIQALLRKGGYYKGRLDQDFAHHSVKSLQTSLNDGFWEQYAA